ncbi:hypothetical protein B484DRAFT_336834, partial [Ochromonadaceae sp. CCMP2298]
VWTNGLRYEGQWVEDKMHGTGAVTNRQGAKYEGQFYNGLKGGMFHGHGVFTCQQGPWYKGNWNGGKRDGQVISQKL